MFIKVSGLTASQLASLEAVLDSDAVRSKEEYWESFSIGGKRHGKVTFAQLLKARYSKEAKSHTVEIEVRLGVHVWSGMDMADCLTGEIELFPPLRVLQAICQAMDRRSFFDEEPVAGKT
ncbi:MAG: hypothetical protein Q7R93_05570 [bacterium]|nr:hypothetical protein [bacterium]